MKLDRLASEIARDVDQLKIIHLFNELSRESLKLILNKMNISVYEENENLIKQGDKVNSVFFVIRGLVQVSYLSESGKVTFLRDYGVGRVFGEVAAFDGHESDGFFRTLEKSLIGEISHKDFRDLCFLNPILAKATLQGMAERTRALIHQLEEMSTLGVKNRIHAELLRRGRQGLTSGDTSEIKPPPKHSDIAFRVNTQREVVTRELNRLEKLGIIRKSRSILTINCMSCLATLIENVGLNNS